MVCRLIIESFHDASARCSCSKWSLAFTGPLSRITITHEWEEHAFENLCRRYPCPSCRHASSMTPVLRGMNGTIWCQCRVCLREFHPYFILGFYEAKEEILRVDTDEQVEPSPPDRDSDPP